MAQLVKRCCCYQRWSRGHKARGQGQGPKKNPRPRPRTAFPRTDTLEAKAKDQGHKRKCSPKKKKVFTKIFQAISKKKKKSSQKFFKRSPRKHVFQKNFQALHKILTIQKLVLSSSRGQANFRGLEASRPRPRTSKSVLEDVLEAKDVLEDSTSGCYYPALYYEWEVWCSRNAKLQNTSRTGEPGKEHWTFPHHSKKSPSPHKRPLATANW